MKSSKTNDGQHGAMVDLSYCYRAAACRKLEGFYPTYESRLGKKLTRKLSVVLEPGETMPDLVFLLRILKRYLSHERRRYRDASDDVLAAEVRYRVALTQRDELLATFKSAYDKVYGVIKSACGVKGLLLSLLGPLCRQPDLMHEQGRSVMTIVRRPDFKLPETDLTAAFNLGRQSFEELLAEPVEALGKVLSKVDRSDREVEAARFRSWRVRAEFETSYSWIGQLTQTLCQLAGEPELAKHTHKPLRELDRRLRPRKRKKQPEAKAATLEAELTESVVAEPKGPQVQIARSLPEAVGDSDLQVVESLPEVQVVADVPESQESDLQVASHGRESLDSRFGSPGRSLRENRRQLAAQTAPGDPGVGRRTVKRSLRRRFVSRPKDGVGGAGDRRGRTGVGPPGEKLPPASTATERAKTSLAERIRRFWVRE